MYAFHEGTMENRCVAPFIPNFGTRLRYLFGCFTPGERPRGMQQTGG